MSTTDNSSDYISIHDYLSNCGIIMDKKCTNSFLIKSKSYCNKNDVPFLEIENSNTKSCVIRLFPQEVLNLVLSYAKDNSEKWYISWQTRLLEKDSTVSLERFIDLNNVVLSRKEYELVLRDLMCKLRYKHRFLDGIPYLLFNYEELREELNNNNIYNGKK